MGVHGHVRQGRHRSDRVGEVDRAPGHAHYDPADVITVFMSARDAAKQRNDLVGRPDAVTTGEDQPS